MSQEISDKAVVEEMSRIGGGGDFFAARERLQQQLNEAERAAARLRPAASEADLAPWQMEPSADDILRASRDLAMTPEDAKQHLRKKLSDDAKRLASFSAQAAAEITEAWNQAEDARNRAEMLYAEHEDALETVATAFITLGHLRQKIAVVRTLLLSDDDKRHLANTALNHFVDMRTGFGSPATSAGFQAVCQDLAFRAELAQHIAAYIQPLERQVATLITSIRDQASRNGMSLRKVFDLLAAERTEPVFKNAEYFAGLLD